MISDSYRDLIKRSFRESNSLSGLKIKFDVFNISYPEDKWSFAKYIDSLMRSIVTSEKFNASWNNWLMKNVDELIDVSKVQSWISDCVNGRYVKPLNKRLMKNWLKKHKMHIADCKCCKKKVGLSWRHW